MLVSLGNGAFFRGIRLAYPAEPLHQQDWFLTAFSKSRAPFAVHTCSLDGVYQPSGNLWSPFDL